MSANTHVHISSSGGERRSRAVPILAVILAIVVTNQSGVARGLFTLSEAAKMARDCGADGVKLEGMKPDVIRALSDAGIEV